MNLLEGQKLVNEAPNNLPLLKLWGHWARDLLYDTLTGFKPGKQTNSLGEQWQVWNSKNCVGETP